MRSEAKARSLELAEGEEVRVGGAKQRDGEKRVVVVVVVVAAVGEGVIRRNLG